MVSRTVMVALAVWLLLLTSVTVKVTKLAPVSLQLKEVLDKLKLATPHASLEPLLT